MSVVGGVVSFCLLWDIKLGVDEEWLLWDVYGGWGLSIMGCEAEWLGGELIMGWPWGGRGDELLWDVSIRAKSEEVGKGWLLWDVWGG